jgi:hypothetical protein
MSNKNPVAARLARQTKRRSQAGSVAEAMEVMWKMICRVEAEVDASYDREAIYRGAHTASACIITYLKAISTGELENRMLALEMQLEALRLSQ